MHTENMIPLWKIPQTELTLAERDIHIWRADLDLQIMGFQKLYQTLSIDERVRAERFHFEKDRRWFIAARGILREILGCYLGVEPNAFRFCYGRNGKPRLAGISGKEAIYFSLSHSEGIALYGFTRNHEIGVDIEYMRDISEMDQIVERFFSVREKRVFHTLPENQKKEAFFKCWTRKEAYLKAVGDGLSRPLESFDVTLGRGEPAILLRMEEGSNVAFRWSIQDLKPTLGFAAAIAVEGENLEFRCWQWSK
jgi:4'-phosphopantetheinyl transferase